MKFIELTQRCGTKLFVNADTIQSVERRPGDDVTTIYTGTSGTPNLSGTIYVQEDPEHVIMLATKENVGYNNSFVNEMRETIIETFNALAGSPEDKVVTCWGAMNKKDKLLKWIDENKGKVKTPEDSDASCLLRSIYQIVFNKGPNCTEEVLNSKEELLQTLCKHKQAYAEQTEPDTRFKDAFLSLLKELYCVDTLCEGSDYYLDRISNSLEYINTFNNFICKVYETLFPDRDTLCSADVVAKIGEVLDEIRDLKNTAGRVHECAKAENALYDTQDELRDVNDTLDRIRDSLQGIERDLEG